MVGIYKSSLLLFACALASCSQHLSVDRLENELPPRFSLANAPPINIGKDKLLRTQEVLGELADGQGGSMVCDASPDPVLDTPEFTASYIREFGFPKSLSKSDLSSYHFKFSKLMGRIWDSPETFSGTQLDWDIWRAFLIFEQINERTQVDDLHYSHYESDSAVDLLWHFFELNAKAICDDPKRREWWIDVLTDGISNTDPKRHRINLLLHLVHVTDSKTSNRPKPPRTGPNKLPLNVAVGLNENAPFLAIPKGEALPPFTEAISQIAEAYDLSFEIWGEEGMQLPATKSYDLDFDSATNQYIGQESWSERAGEVPFAHPICRRTDHSKKGVFFFTFDACLYVWPKAKSFESTIELMHLTGMIDSAKYTSLLKNNFEPITKITGKIKKVKLASIAVPFSQPIIVQGKLVNPFTGQVLGSANNTESQDRSVVDCDFVSPANETQISGEILSHFAENSSSRSVVAASMIESDFILLKPECIMRLDRNGKHKRWEIDLKNAFQLNGVEWWGGENGKIFQLPGGDMVMAQWGWWGNVFVLRFNPSTQKIIWATVCEGIGMRGTHTGPGGGLEVDLAIRKDRLLVICTIYASSVETVALDSGLQISRWLYTH